MDNRDKVKAIIDRQVEKLHELSEKQRMPLPLNEIKSLSELAKIIADVGNLTSTDKKKTSEFSDEELLLVHAHRQKKAKELL